ncbi:MAG: hypothetical protein HQ538_04150 [Parcubacteria group bacterium]|nr:hypothetical protein [Parcubacteria group bacterium]
MSKEPKFNLYDNGGRVGGDVKTNKYDPKIGIAQEMAKTEDPYHKRRLGGLMRASEESIREGEQAAAKKGRELADRENSKNGELLDEEAKERAMILDLRKMIEGKQEITEAEAIDIIRKMLNRVEQDFGGQIDFDKFSEELGDSRLYFSLDDGRKMEFYVTKGSNKEKDIAYWLGPIGRETMELYEKIN